jgi:four helix bundle protein
MMKPDRKPYGYRELLVYKKAEVVQMACSELTHLFPRMKTLIALADQMDRSARSVKQNIVEGWKRNTSKEYYDFLGFSMGANSELEEDCDDIWKNVYPELMGIKGVMGERGGKMGEMGGMGEKGLRGNIEDIEKLKFYPLDPSLPPVVKLKLQCKELNYLLTQLQKSLVDKMESERTLPMRDILQKQSQEKKKREGDFEMDFLKPLGLRRLPNGQVVKDE